MTLILRDVATKARAIDPNRRYAEFVASTEAIDSHESIVRQTWNLDRYTANPVILRDHQTGRVIGRGNFMPGATESIVGITFARGTVDAEETWALVEQDMLRAVSIGFLPGKATMQKIAGRDVVVYEDTELYEISVVAIPSNPDSLARAYRESDEVEAQIRAAALVGAEALPSKGNTMSEKTEPAPVADKQERAGHPDSITRAEHDLAIKAYERTTADLKVQLDTERAARLATEETVKKLDGTRREAKLADLVGRKLTEAQLPEFRALLESNETVFDGVVKSLPDLGGSLPLVGKAGRGSSAIGADAPATRSGLALDGEELDKALFARTDERMKTLGENRQAAMRGAMQDLKDKGQLALGADHGVSSSAVQHRESAHRRVPCHGRAGAHEGPRGQVRCQYGHRLSGHRREHRHRHRRS